MYVQYHLLKIYLHSSRTVIYLHRSVFVSFALLIGYYPNIVCVFGIYIYLLKISLLFLFILLIIDQWNIYSTGVFDHDRCHELNWLLLPILCSITLTQFYISLLWWCDVSLKRKKTNTNVLLQLLLLSLLTIWEWWWW